MYLNNKLHLFWKIGEFTLKYKDNFDNVVSSCSNRFSYYYGFSDMFSVENIHLMRRFYCFFPIFFKRLEDLNWEHYKLLVNVFDVEERMFYFKVSIFCNINSNDLKYLINSNYFIMLKKRDS